MPFPRVCIVSASGQNVFFAEILEALGSALREAGVEVEESVDCFPPLRTDLVYLFIPHEYEPLVDELARPTALQLRRSIVLGTEQPGNQWFELAASAAARAGAVVDINELGTAELRRRGIDTTHLPLGYIPTWDAWGGDLDRQRPVDVAFLGAHTPRRAAVLARCARSLAHRETALHVVENSRPHTLGDPRFLAHDRKWRLMADSKVVLNVHRDPLGYMEWHRLLGAVLNGAVVVSEHSLGIEPFVPGEHFVSSGLGSLPFVLDAVLADETLQGTIRAAAYEVLRERMPMSRAVGVLVEAAERANRTPLPALAPAPPSVPLPVTPPSPPADWERSQGMGEMFGVRMALKDLVLSNRVLRHQLRALQRREAGVQDEDVVEQFGPELEQPRVSVLLTIYNYADYVADALRSVAAGGMSDVEIVAVDDGSDDGSSEVVRETCAQLPSLPVRLIRRSRNHGLPAGRNLAAEHARADLLFILDADNAVLARGLQRLADALDADPEAGFAYGLIESFDQNGPRGIMNYLQWDPRRLREGNYIDAMAMIRRSSLEAVGGFANDPALFGWEDFALWLAMAHAGIRGVRVPAFVARYRVGVHSMISVTNIDSQAAWAVLLRRFPSLA